MMNKKSAHLRSFSLEKDLSTQVMAQPPTSLLGVAFLVMLIVRKLIKQIVSCLHSHPFTNKEAARGEKSIGFLVVINSCEQERA